MKIGKYLFIILSSILILESCNPSQYYAKEKLADWQKYGYIIDADGNRIDGLIILDAWGTLWRNQSTIGFCPQSKIDEASSKGNDKVKATWYTSKELKGYGYDDKVFVTRTIRLNTGETLRMLEILSGKNKTYKFYNSTNFNPSAPKYVVVQEGRDGIVE